jgi:hypothetical protein
LDEDDLELVNSFGVERSWNARTNQIKKIEDQLRFSEIEKEEISLLAKSTL